MSMISEVHFKSMHVYFGLLAQELNDAGFDFKRFLEVSEYQAKVDFDKEIVKNWLWRPVQIAMTGKISTTEITAYEAIKIYEILGKRVAELTGASVPWPRKEIEDVYS